MHTQTKSTPPAEAPSDRSRTYFDVRLISCRQKHALIFQRWAVLEPGEHFVLVNDHDPVPLHRQFAGQFPGAFEWEYLLAGPDEFHVKITRLKTTSRPVRQPDLPPWPPRGNQSAAAGESVVEVDARGLEPPEPMVRILSALEALPAGGVLRARTERRPIHLFPELDARGARHESTEQPDGSWITTLRRA